MCQKINIVEATNELGLGGTEYTLQLYSKYLNKEIFNVTVVAIKNGGVRVDLIREFGIDVKVLYEDYNLLSEILKDVDVLHWHGSGSISENYKFFERVHNSKPRLVIQTNIFGLYDIHPWYKDLIDYDLYVSKMVLARRMAKDKVLPYNFADKRKVLNNPVDVDNLRELISNENEIQTFKDENDLNGFFLVGRLGRASDAKFDFITIDAFKEFIKLNAKAKLFMNGVTPKMREYIKKLGLINYFVEMPNTSNLKQLVLYYSVIDVFLACSAIGESFGMVMVESMAVGTPVVTVNTPDRDNAQIEVVDNNVNGFVTNRLSKAIAKAIHKINYDPDLKNTFSKNSVLKIKNHYDAKKTIKSFEKLILNHFNRSNDTDGKNDTLIVDWSEKMTDDYNLRMQNVEGRYTICDKLFIAIERNRIYKKLVRIKQKIIE